MRFITDHDYHVHTNLSKCACFSGQTAEKLIEYGRKYDITDICITNHLFDDAFPQTIPWYEYQNFEHISKILPLPKDDKVTLHFGAETELDVNNVLACSEKVLEKLEFLAIPISHFHSTGFKIPNEEADAKYRAEVWVERFYNVLRRDLPFNKIGFAHLTVRHMDNRSWQHHIDIVNELKEKDLRELFTLAAKKGAGIELNMPLNSYSEEDRKAVFRVYKIAKECGAKFYMGSDGHKQSDLDSAKSYFETYVDILSLKESDKFRPFSK